MVERVTNNVLHDQALHAVNSSRKKQLKNQEISINLKRVNRPADDPVGSTQILKMRNVERNTRQFLDNGAAAINLLSSADRAIETATDILARAYELAISQSSSASSTPDTRKAIAKEVEQLKAQLINVANTRFGDRYLFGGYQTKSPPFSAQGFYNGDFGVIPFEIQENYFIPVNVPGSIPFMGTDQPGFQQVRSRNIAQSKPKEAAAPKQDRVKAEVKKTDKSADVKEKSGTQKLAVQGAIIKAPEQVNVFQLMDDFIFALNNNDQIGVQNTLDSWDVAQAQIFTARAAVGARINSIERARETLEIEEVNQAKLRSELEDADALKAFTEVNKDEDVLKRTLAVSQKLIASNLFDFLK